MTTLNAAAQKALRSKDVSDRLSGEAAEIVASSPAELGKFFNAEVAKWAGVIAKAGIKPESW